jgi:hypothetical protein
MSLLIAKLHYPAQLGGLCGFRRSIFGRSDPVIAESSWFLGEGGHSMPDKPICLFHLKTNFYYSKPCTFTYSKYNLTDLSQLAKVFS